MKKILNIQEGGIHLECLKKDSGPNPYRLYTVWWDSGSQHRKQIAKYADFQSVVYCVADISARISSWH